MLDQYKDVFWGTVVNIKFPRYDKIVDCDNKHL